MYKFLTLVLLTTTLYGFETQAMERDDSDSGKLPHSSVITSSSKPTTEDSKNDKNSFDVRLFQEYPVGIYDLKVRAQVRKNDLLIDYYSSIWSETGYYPMTLNYLYDWAVYSKLVKCQIRMDVLLQMIWAVVKDENDQYEMTTSDAGLLTQGWHMTTVWGLEPQAIIQKFQEKHPNIKTIFFTFPSWMKGTESAMSEKFGRKLKEIQNAPKIEFGWY